MTYIVTDNIHRTHFQSTKEDVLYVGYGGLTYEEALDTTNILANVWSCNTEKKFADKEIKEMYEEALLCISPKLNQLHNENFDNKYWETIIGPWLLSCLSILTERRGNVDLATDKYSNLEFISKSFVTDAFVPQDYQEFCNFRNEELFHHFLYGKLVKLNKNVIFTLIDSPTVERQQRSLFTQSKIENFKGKLQRLIGKFFFRNVHLSITNSYISRSLLIKILFKLKSSFVMFTPQNVFNSVTEVNSETRKKLHFDTNHTTLAELLDLIIYFMPMAYVENYKTKKLFISKYYPQKVKVINTAVNDIGNDDFKIWAALMRFKGARYLINQHGGLYGSGLLTPVEYLQRRISDKFITWGWSDEMDDLIVCGALKLSRTKIKRVINQKKILIILLSQPKFPYWCTSVPCGKSLVEYYSNQIDFFDGLKESVKANTYIRFGLNDHGWNFESFFKSKREIKTDEEPSFIKSIESASICICTYNATTMFETIVKDIPTVMFWDEKHFPLRADAKLIYQRLIDVNVLHFNVQSACKHVNSIANDGGSWWRTVQVQSALELFMNYYAAPVEVKKITSIFT
jgi:putative transferase (TIGR04331 family)